MSGPLPDLESLKAGLAEAFRDLATGAGTPTVLSREPNAHGYEHKEIVTCRLADGRELRLFCKYDRHSRVGAVAYEARVYREVLEPLEVFSLRCYASPVEDRTGRTWLLLEYLDGVDELESLDESDAMRLAAGWLGRFHAACDRHFRIRPTFLHRYDVDFYVGCARLALAAADGRLAWLRPLGERLDDFLRPLMGARSTIIHGDFHLENLLFRQGSVCPVDWEMAGINLGEADLVFLLDGWPEEVKQACTLEYRRARWPTGAPADFELALRTAWLCFCLHKVAGRQWLDEADYQRYRRHLRSVAEPLGLCER